MQVLAVCGGSIGTLPVDVAGSDTFGYFKTKVVRGGKMPTSASDLVRLLDGYIMCCRVHKFEQAKARLC